MRRTSHGPTEPLPPPEADRKERRRGLALLELLVALAVLLALAGVLLPIRRRPPAENRRELALAPLLSLAANSSRSSIDASGAIATTGGRPIPGLSDPLRLEDLLGRGLSLPPSDPWGGPWVVFVPSGGGPGLALSAGPDGEIQTRPGDPRARGDDLAVPFRLEGDRP